MGTMNYRAPRISGTCNERRRYMALVGQDRHIPRDGYRGTGFGRWRSFVGAHCGHCLNGGGSLLVPAAILPSSGRLSLVEPHQVGVIGN